MLFAEPAEANVLTMEALEVRAKYDKILRRVEKGETILVTRNGIPQFRLQQVSDEERRQHNTLLAVSRRKRRLK
jgi:prevent-host-death family protein